MYHVHSIRSLSLLCCLMLTSTAVWGDHPRRAGPRTPVQEQARQLASLGLNYLRQQDYRQAAMAFQTATQLDPEDADAYFQWGVALGILGQRQEEIEKYQQALHYNPALGEAYVGWALALLQLGQQAEAKAKLAEVLAVAPGVIPPQQIPMLKALGLIE